MVAELANPNLLLNGDLKIQKETNAIKPKETGRRRRRKQKKNKKHNNEQNGKFVSKSDVDDDSDDAKENTDPKQPLETIEIEYVAEKADVDDSLLADFKRVFEKFSFGDTALVENDEKKNEAAESAAVKKKLDSDSDEEEQDVQKKENGVSNKKKKVQRRMKIAELKQVSSRPDVVEVWDATAADPKLLVYLKSYRNSVPVPRHWSQKRKFLQETGCYNLGAWTWWCSLEGAVRWLLF